LYNLYMSEMNIGIQQSLKQELKMTPEMLQSIRILQMNTLELSEYIAQEVETNPVLEEMLPPTEVISSEQLQERMEDRTIDPLDAYDRYDRYERYDYFERSGNSSSGASNDASDFEKYVHQDETLQEHLLEQLASFRIPERIFRVCEYLIGSLDDDGYLPADEEWLDAERDMSADDNRLKHQGDSLNNNGLNERSELSQDEYNQALELLQGMDPIGVGARNLPECLKLQLKERGALTPQLQALIDTMLEDIASNQIGKIAKMLGIRKMEARDLVGIIRDLEPKPGRRFSDGQAVPFLVPDVIVEKIGNQLHVRLNDDATPRLQLSGYYRDLLARNKRDREVSTYLSDKFRSAEYLMQGVRQRGDTLLRITEAIVAHQSTFFEPGNKFLSPLTMQELADELELNVSTVSRAIDGKYMECDGGIFSLRHFFGSGVTLSNNDSNESDAISSVAVHQMIVDLINDEDKTHPLSDQKIADWLIANGVHISRRTVAKYREAEGIESTSKRKKL
jgi:RNA polymerase sigma-54 factor